MSQPVEPDQVLLKMPSLRAVKSFVAAAKYQNFTRAAEALCVTQAAISRQIRELENYLGVELFIRTGRSVELTSAGSTFYDAAYLSFVNIAQAASRVKNNQQARANLTICASPAFSALWLSKRLVGFLADHPQINVEVLTTENFRSMEPNVQPDIFINKTRQPKQGYRSVPLFHDLIFPVCSPDYLAKHGPIESLEDLATQHKLLNLSPYGRSQVAEHVDWQVWLGFHGYQLDPASQQQLFNSNDYSLLVRMATHHQGISLGWQHLVAPMLESGELVRALDLQFEHRDTRHYLSYRETLAESPRFSAFKQWFLAELAADPLLPLPGSTD